MHEITLSGTTITVEIIDPLALRRRRSEDDMGAGGIVKAMMPGRVVRVLAGKGDTVAKGQLLLRLDPETYRNAIDRETAGRRQATIDIERQRATLKLREAQYARSQALAKDQLIDRNRLEEDRPSVDRLAGCQH